MIRQTVASMMVVVAAMLAAPCSAYAQERILVTIVEVVEGDTVRAADSQGRVELIRLAGVDSPELNHPQLGTQCWSQESLGRMRELLPAGEPVSFELESTQRDASGRLLGYVYAGDRNVSEVLATEGHAVFADLPPPARYATQLRAAADSARDQKLGLWQACPGPVVAVAEAPATATPAPAPVVAAAPQPTPTVTFAFIAKPSSSQGGPGDCPPPNTIKGNHSSSGERIYHVRGGQFYDRTWAEECFATEADARAAGYRRSLR
jgi:micrococcal nuclease